MFQKQQVVTHPVRRILILLLALLLVCGTPTWANAESSSDLQSIVQIGDTVQIEATNATAKNELNELEETGGAVLFSTEASQMVAKDNVELTYTRTIQYEGYFTRNFRVKVDGKTKVAYCVQPKETPPPEGNHTAEDYNNKLMTKALYYSYGYAGYDKHTKQYVSKRDDDDDWTDDDGAYALCHMILSYLYDKSSADSDAFNGVSSDTIKLVKQVADKIENDWPDAPTDSTLTLNHDSVNATWQQADQEQKTPIFKLTAHEDNRIHIKLPEGVKIHRTRNGSTQTFGNQRTIKIYGGDSFYFTADKSVRGTWKSGNLEGSLTSFNPYIIRVTGHQNIVFCGTGETNKVSFSVNWVEWGYLKVTKSLEDGQKMIDLGINLYDGITFSLTGNGENRTLTPNKNGELTDSSGEYPLELLPGTYTLTETSVPDRYREKLVKQFTVTGGQTTTGDLKNITKKGNFSLIKVYDKDLDDDESLVFDREEGVVFRVWDSKYQQAGWTFEEVPDFFKDEITTNTQGEAKTKDLPVGHYIVQQVTKDKNHWAVEDFEIDIEDKETTTQPITIIGNKTATQEWLKIIKVDADTDKPVEVAGTQFQIKDSEGNIMTFLDDQQQPIDTFTTNAEGIAIVRGTFLPGDYEVVEVKAPEGYALAKDPVKFTVDSDIPKGETIEVKVADKAQKVELVLHKQAEEFVTGDKRYSYEKVAMPFVKFDLVAAFDIVTPDGSIRLQAGETAQEGLLTNEQGTVTSDPQYPGDYNVVEKGLYSKLRTYTLNEGDVTNILTNWQLALQNAGESLPPQEEQDAFKSALTTLTSEYQIDKDGNTSWSTPTSEAYAFNELQMEILETYLKDLPENQIEESWKDLSLDRYRVTEDGIVATVTLKAGDQSQEVTQQELTIVNELKKGDLELTKADISNGEPLPDTGMRIYLDDKETVIFKGRTDQDGKIILKDLVEGNYYYQEFDSPEGYLIDEGLYPFTIKDGEITKCEMTNKLQMGIIELQKGGETYKIKDKDEYVYSKTNALANATFEVVAAEDIKSPTGKVYARKGVTVATITTDETGKAVTPEIHLGSYILKETKAPEGYVICSKDIPVLLTADEATDVVTVKVNAENRLAKGTVEITKTDVSDGEPLPDTGIQIYDKDKEVILKGRTDENGKLTFEKLPVGIYYFQEFDAPKGYQIKEDLYQFEIKEDGDIVKCKMTNKAKDGTVAITTTDKNGNVVQTGDEFPLIILLFLMAGSGLFAVVYRVRKKETGSDEA